MARGAVIDETGLEGRFYPGNAAFIDVGFFLFSGSEFDTEIKKFLSINQSDSQLFLLSCIDEHSFHVPLLDVVGLTGVRREAARTACGCLRGGEDS